MASRPPEEARLQSQVRALSREVGTVKEELAKEVKRRERLAVRAKECEELLGAAEAKANSLGYVNRKLEQEVATLKERVQGTSAKNKSGLEALRARLSQVEQSVTARAVEAQRQLQAVRRQVQELAGVALPLAVVAAAAAKPAAAAQRGAAAGPRAGRQQHRLGAAQQRPVLPTRPSDLHHRFAQLLAALSKLSEAITGHSGSEEESAAATTAAPLLLTAPDGSCKAVQWGDGEAAATVAQGRAGTAAPAFDAEKEQMRAQVQQLQAELSAARRSRAAVAGGGGRVEAAVQQLNAVVPQYRAAASALQGHVTVLNEKLAVACRERGQLQEEVLNWRQRAQQLEAAFGQATAQVHAKEAQALALSSQAQSQSEKLSSEAEALRQRCTELGARLRGTQQEVARLQAAVQQKDRVLATQQCTILQLESTVRDQQEDIRSALDLVTGRNGAGCSAAAAAAVGGPDMALSGHAANEWDDLGSDMGACSGSPHLYSPSALGADPACGLDPLPTFDAELLPDPLAGGLALDPGWDIHAAPAAATGCCFEATGADSSGFGAVSVSPRAQSHSPAVSSLARLRQQQGKGMLLSPGLARPKSAGRGGTGVASIEAEIAGLEDALRKALSDLNV